MAGMGEEKLRSLVLEGCGQASLLPSTATSVATQTVDVWPTANSSRQSYSRIVEELDLAGGGVGRCQESPSAPTTPV